MDVNGTPSLCSFLHSNKKACHDKAIPGKRLYRHEIIAIAPLVNPE
jgi:hypothetical protein